MRVVGRFLSFTNVRRDIMEIESTFDSFSLTPPSLVILFCRRKSQEYLWHSSTGVETQTLSMSLGYSSCARNYYHFNNTVHSFLLLSREKDSQAHNI